MAKATRTTREVSVEDALSEAFGEFSSLAEEMRSWSDNLEEKFSNTEKYSRVTEAADTLENHTDAPDVDEVLKDVKVTIADLPKKRRGHSRADRCGQACYILDVVIDVLQGVADDEKASQDKRDAASSLIDDLDSPKGDCENVEFPGMFG